MVDIADGGVPDLTGRLRADLNLASGGWLLVRPDGYVAARGKRWDAAAFRAAVDAVVPRPAALERV